MDPADDTLYVAAHYGVLRVEDGDHERVADRWPAQALDVVAGRWHAATESGIHESTDDGRSWDVVLEPGED